MLTFTNIRHISALSYLWLMKNTLPIKQALQKLSPPSWVEDGVIIALLFYTDLFIPCKENCLGGYKYSKITMNPSQEVTYSLWACSHLFRLCNLLTPLNVIIDVSEFLIDNAVVQQVVLHLTAPGSPV